LRQGKPQADAAVIIDDFGVGLLKNFKDRCLCRVGDPDACVLNIKTNTVFGFSYVKNHAAHRREFDGIGQQNRQYLTHSHRVETHLIRHIRFDLSHQFQALIKSRKLNELKRVKELEAENSRLKRMYADLALENAAIKDVLSRKL
jgi:hypothetical protein